MLVAARRLHPDELTAAARKYLPGIVDHDDLWDSRNGNRDYMFKQAGLPYDRATIAASASSYGLSLRDDGCGS